MLFISDNIKIDAIVKKLQPSLKLKIIIERDFDCGLNDVFEKRPDVVLIQNQIAGVTGESVARHIQMLLGSMAPKFILIHAGDATAKPIPGLYDHLIDLSPDEETVAADILSKLNLVLGPRWQTIFSIAPSPEGASVADSISSAATTAENFPPFTLDDLPDFPAVKPVVAASVPSQPLEEFPAADFLAGFAARDVQRAAMLSAECETLELDKAPHAPLDAASSEGQVSPAEAISSGSANEQYAADLSEALSEITRPAGEAQAGSGTQAVLPGNTRAVHDGALKESTQPLPSHKAREGSKTLHASPESPAELVNPLEAPLFEDKEADPWMFDGEPRLPKKQKKWYHFFELLLVLCLLVGGWYVIKQKPQPVQPAAHLPATSAPQAPAEKVMNVLPARKDTFPAFIPQVGHDPAFAAQNPGWERYVGPEAEFRLFSEKGALKAVQVKAENGHVISEALLKGILLELTGVSDYKEMSRENKFGLELLHAQVAGKAELLIYLKKTAIQALVVSLD